MPITLATSMALVSLITLAWMIAYFGFRRSADDVSNEVGRLPCIIFVSLL